MATFPIARLYYSPPFLFPRHSAAQDSGWSPDVLPKAVWITDIEIAVNHVRKRAERCVACTHSTFKETKREGSEQSECPQECRRGRKQEGASKEHLKNILNQNDESLKWF